MPLGELLADGKRKLGDLLNHPATSNPLLAAKFARQRANLTQPESVMDERYPAWKKAQDDADKFMLLSDVIGAAVPLAGPAARMGVAGVKSMAPQAANMAEGYMTRSGMMPQITAYHGSPHKFDAFDSSKIGTGEGAQAYGHGLYLAENPAVAKEYSNITAPVNRKIMDLNYQLESFGRQGFEATSPEVMAINKKIQKLMTDESKNLYTVDLPDAHIAKMLDWDKPLSQQPESVRNGLKQLGINIDDPRYSATLGQDFYANLISHAAESSNSTKRLWWQDSPKTNDTKAIVSEQLKKAGIPGIKYLDGGSRGAGSGTRNFVVFPGEEKALKILERK